MDKKKTGNLIREARIKKNYTQSELGDLLGVSNKAVSRWENGDSFPDVGILEDLSSILDIQVQNLITGNVEDNSESISRDLVRVIKLQSKEKKRKVISYVLIVLVLLCCFISGYTALWKCHLILTINSILVYSIFMIISYVLLILIKKSITVTINEESNRLSKCMEMISLFSLIFCILITWYIFLSSIKGYHPFGLELESIGVFINNILIIVFMINFIILVMAFYRFIKMNIRIHSSIVVAIGCIFMSVLYGDMLCKLSTVDEIIGSLIVRTAIVSICMMIILIVFNLDKNDCSLKS